MTYTPPDLLDHVLDSVLDCVRDAAHDGDLEKLDRALSDVTTQLRTSSPTTTHAVTKLDEERQLVYGWALVSTEHGEELVDRQDDVVSTDDLRDAAHDFIKGDRTLGRMHRTMGVGEVVESVVLSKGLQRALGIDLGVEGWFVGVHVSDPETWQSVKKGELRMFSIGGSGERTAFDKRGAKVTLFREAWGA